MKTSQWTTWKPWANEQQSPFSAKHLQYQIPDHQQNWLSNKDMCISFKQTSGIKWWTFVFLITPASFRFQQETWTIGPESHHTITFVYWVFGSVLVLLVQEVTWFHSFLLYFALLSLLNSVKYADTTYILEKHFYLAVVNVFALPKCDTLIMSSVLFHRDTHPASWGQCRVPAAFEEELDRKIQCIMWKEVRLLGFCSKCG